MDQSQASACESLFTLAPPAFLEYEKCLQTKLNSADLSIPGIAIDVRTRCACESKITDALDALGCCNHPDIKIACEIRCNPDCSTESAKQCLDTCPALCLEDDYAPPSCSPSCLDGQCHKDLLCITENARNETMSGEMTRVCHERDFANSKELQAYHDCQARHSHRTVWQRHSAALHCICESNMAGAAQNANCCGTSWGGAVCSMECSVDCKSAEAKNCVSECSQLCDQLPVGETADSVKTTQQCYNFCLVQGGACSRYAMCPPESYPDFPYICDTGDAPLTNGCCANNPIGPNGSSCPQMCKSQNSFPIPEKSGYECFCDGCPKTMDETVDRYESFVRNELHENGLYILSSVARDEGLKYPNMQMKSLMDERNEMIMNTLTSNSLSLAEKERIINQLNMEYVLKIKEAAKKGPDPPEKEKKEEEKDDGNTVLLVIAIVALVVACLAMVFGCIMIRKYKRATEIVDISCKTPEEIRAAAEQLQTSDNMTVVIGQPVAGERGAITGGAPQGVPQALKGASMTPGSPHGVPSTKDYGPGFD